VALIGLFNHLRKEDKLNKHEIAELAHEIANKELGNKGGRQDEYAAAFGGINFIEFKGNDFVRVNPVKIKNDYLLELEKHLVLAFVGARGESGKIQELLAKQQQSYTKEEKMATLDKLKEFAKKMHFSLTEGKLDEFGKMIGESWKQKMQLNPNMTNEKIDHLYNTAIANGALGGRITGAGGGGCMIFYCKSNTEQIVAKKLEEAGARVIDFSFDKGGLQTWQVSKDDREA
jgi:D-glycero-alpha-D-manno-heptose-7-phosphate kinase